MEKKNNKKTITFRKSHTGCVTKRFKPLQPWKLQCVKFSRVSVLWVFVASIYQSDANVRNCFQTCVLLRQREQLTKARCAPVGEYVCQQLSRCAGRTPQWSLSTNLSDKQCHPLVRNIYDLKERATKDNKYHSSSLVSWPLLCFDAARLCWHVSGYIFCIPYLTHTG